LELYVCREPPWRETKKSPPWKQEGKKGGGSGKWLEIGKEKVPTTKQETRVGRESQMKIPTAASGSWKKCNGGSKTD